MKNFLGALVIVGLGSAAYFIYSSPKTGILQESQASREPVINVISAPIATATAENSVVHSPDGSMVLSMKKTASTGGTVYSFYVSGGGVSSRAIFTQTVTSGEMSLPANSWSPDNKDFFVKQKTGTVSSYLVFKGNGENFTDGSKYLDVAALFTQKKIDYGLRNVTGWDAPDLLHVQTSGPNFWFEIPSKAFIQLAS